MEEGVEELGEWFQALEKYLHQILASKGINNSLPMVRWY